MCDAWPELYNWLSNGDIDIDTLFARFQIYLILIQIVRVFSPAISNRLSPSHALIVCPCHASGLVLMWFLIFGTISNVPRHYTSLCTNQFHQKIQSRTLTQWMCSFSQKGSPKGYHAKIDWKKSPYWVESLLVKFKIGTNEILNAIPSPK